jgi:hypothetical protein
MEGANFNPNNTQIALQSVKIGAVSNVFCGLKNLTVLGYLGLPASGPLVDFTNNTDSVIENVILSVAGVVLDTTTNYLADISMAHNGYVKNLRFGGGFDFPIASQSTNALVRLTGTGGRITGLVDTSHNAGNVSASTDPFCGISILVNNAMIQSVTAGAGSTIVVGGDYADVSGLEINNPQGYGLYYQGTHGNIHGVNIINAGGGNPGFYDGISIIGDMNHINNNTIESSPDALNALHIASGTNNVVNDNFLVASASGSNFQDDGTTTRAANNYTS